MSLNLDDFAGDDARGPAETTSEGYADKCIAAGVEEEKCVIAAYRTSEAHTKAFRSVLADCADDRTKIPVEWVIDIADESNGWFYGTAYHYDDVSGMLHVMVPDKLNPTFDGFVPLDHRTVHLIECVDKKTDALFNKIVRDSVVKVRWEVDWYEEHERGESFGGRWILSTARFLVRIANQLLVEDEDFGQDTKGFVMLTADHNLRLRKCIKGKGQEDFRRLISETLVQSAPDALDSLEYTETSGPATPGPTATAGKLGGSSTSVLGKVFDENNYPYYHNEITGETSWDRPEGFPEHDDDYQHDSHHADAEAFSNLAHQQHSSHSVHDDGSGHHQQHVTGEVRVGDWVQVHDSETGMPYWRNDISGESVWELPPDAHEASVGQLHLEDPSYINSSQASGYLSPAHSSIEHQGSVSSIDYGAASAGDYKIEL